MPTHLTDSDPAPDVLVKLSNCSPNQEQIVVPAEEAARQFDIFKRDFEYEARKAEESEAEAHARNARIHQERVRVEAGLPEPHVCPNCWVKHGVIRLIVAGSANDPTKYQRWECNGDCGYFFDVPVR